MKRRVFGWESVQLEYYRSTFDMIYPTQWRSCTIPHCDSNGIDHVYLLSSKAFLVHHPKIQWVHAFIAHQVAYNVAHRLGPLCARALYGMLCTIGHTIYTLLRGWWAIYICSRTQMLIFNRFLKRPLHAIITFSLWSALALAKVIN